MLVISQISNARKMKKGEKETSGGKMAMEKTTQFHHKQQETCMQATVSALDIFIWPRTRPLQKKLPKTHPILSIIKWFFLLGNSVLTDEPTAR